MIKIQLYPVGDYVDFDELEKLGLKPHQRHLVRAKPTGEFRPPLKGEWFLSGAIIEGWKTRGDLSTPYYIAKLVRVKTRTIEIEVNPDGSEGDSYYEIP